MASERNKSDRSVLLTGATGYVGGRLLKKLREAGIRPRCLARRPEELRRRAGPEVDVVGGDVMDADSLRSALAGIDAAYYLVHSMGSSGAFEERDRVGADNFAQAAREARVRRIIYLGGLGSEREELSPHLRSRHEVGEILRTGADSVVEFRASIILGAGSLSFELIRALVERLPIMITPRWVQVSAQPIAISDVLRYLVAALDVNMSGHRIYEIGGADSVAYARLMKEYARQRGLSRGLIPVPVLTPWLSSLWLALVTPIYARVGRKLIESIRHPTVVRDKSAGIDFAITPMGVREAMAEAFREEDEEFAQKRWGEVLTSKQTDVWFGVQVGSRRVDSRTIAVKASAAEAFAPIRRIGGETGWYSRNWLWRLRGAVDALIGGIGLRRGRRDPEDIRPGDTVDCWRVEDVQPDRRLRLANEMKLPGRAWLELEVSESKGISTIRQTVIFDPVGLLGRAYWYLTYPLHDVVFAGMLRGIANKTGTTMTSESDLTRARSPIQWAVLGLFLILCLGVAALGGAVTSSSVDDWYLRLKKPSWNPPNWIFGPVWTTLYISMAIAAWLVWRKQGWPGAKSQLLIFGAQLFLNCLWSFLFFGLQSPGWALIEIVFLWFAIVATILSFARVSDLSALILLPYLAWVTFAAALNASLWALN